MKPIIDTHCHLDLEQFDADRVEMLQRAQDAGVAAMVLIGFNPDRWRETAKLCADRPEMVRTVGIHPNDAEIWDGSVRADLIQEIKSGNPVAVGEIGLDFFRSRDTAEQQQQAFEEQLEIAREHDLPVVIHQRAAELEVLRTLSGTPGVRGVMHCFTGDLAYAERTLELGFYLGIGGVVTYPKSDDVREAVAAAPSDRLLLETDAPFLAPQSHRGKRNEPAYLSEIIMEVARVRGTTVEAVAEQTTENALRLFGPALKGAMNSGMEH